MAVYLALIPAILLIMYLRKQSDALKAEIDKTPVSTAPSEYVWYADPVSWVMILMIINMVAYIVAYGVLWYKRQAYPRQYEFMRQRGFLIAIAVQILLTFAIFFI